VKQFIYTNADRDGMLNGPDIDEVKRIASVIRGRWIYSGGISSVDDLRALTARVEAAKSSSSGVTVIADGVTVRARFAILALAPVLYPRISFEPPLPRLQHQMHQHISM
ncbi:HisA/HisF-related TIM barrel protein, partial [Klebsiella pneumoniae]|uniref:HisA/HisF-related TIM barrel protein n=1 Tax=Klebsiella pneumoniae TaxID=573 RepID=UPI003A88375D